MAEWPEVRLSSVTRKIGSGATPRGGKEVYQAEGVAFIRSQNVHDGRFTFEGLARLSDEAANDLRGVAVQDGDVLINITGESVTRTCLVPPGALPARVSQHVAIVRADRSQLEPRYLLAALLNPPTKSHLNLISEAGATRRALTKAHLEETRIALPPLDEQRQIARALGRLDDLIETNRQLIVNLEDLACSLTTTAPKQAHLSDLAAFKATKQSKPTGVVEYFSIPAFDSDTVPEIIDGGAIKSSKYRITSSSVLVSRLNPKWQRCWMAYPGERAFASTEFLILQGSSVPVEVVWACASTGRFWEQMRSLAGGTTGSHQRVDKSRVESISVPDVRQLPEVTLHAIVGMVRAVAELRSEIVKLARARDELLPLLMSGRVRVGEGA